MISLRGLPGHPCSRVCCTLFAVTACNDLWNWDSVRTSCAPVRVFRTSKQIAGAGKVGRLSGRICSGALKNAGSHEAGAAASAGFCPGGVMPAGNSVPENVLDFFLGLPEISLYLVGRPLGCRLIVSRSAAGLLLDGACELLDFGLGLLSCAHDALLE